jgi:pimeloyl-ACP methyl ester carboxylesterase
MRIGERYRLLMDHQLRSTDGRTLGVAEFGDQLGTPVLWCHGGPGSRLEPMWLDQTAADVEAHGENGSKLLGGGMDAALADSDRQLFADPTWMTDTMTGFPAMFTFGLQGYADDRIADGSGWTGFDVTQIRCPVTVLHGTQDRMVDIIHPRHTAELIPGADLILRDGSGHFSIETHIVPEVLRILRRR